MATHPSILAWRIPMDRGAWGAIYGPRVHKESDTAEQLSMHMSTRTHRHININK